MNNLEKPGLKTTEFWVSVLTPILVPIVMMIFDKIGIRIPEEALTIIISSSVGTPIAYVLGRIYNKKKIADIEITKNKIQKN